MNSSSHNHSYNSPNNYYNSLPRSSSSLSNSVNNTPTSSGNRALPPRGFGTNNYVLKEDYEKERVRWMKELQEAESKLSQFSVVNTELAQTKAQLNKKIIDIEKNQKPMVECNKRLAERNKTLMDSCKNLEETLSFVRDEKLTLKDQYDRLIKENSSLREQRAFPEKLEELERYRNQVLEYSKCITALRQSLVDKDRRHELLIQKLRKIKKALSVRRDDDEQSERSVGSSIALDTIAEDLDEDPALLANGDIQPTIYEQLETANNTMNELRSIFGLDNNSEDRSICLVSKVVRLKEEHKTLSERIYMLDLELANARDSSDLLEFQLVEMTSSSKTQNTFMDQECETDEFSIDSIHNEPEIEHKLNFDEEFVNSTKSSLKQVERLFVLKSEHKKSIRDGVACIMGLEHKLSFAHNQLDMSNFENKRITKLSDEIAAELREKLASASETSSQKKKEMKVTIEKLKLESEKQSKELNSLQKCQEDLKEQLDHAESEKENFRKSLEESTDKINEIVESLQNANKLVEDLKKRLRDGNEKIEEQEERIRILEADLLQKQQNVNMEIEMERMRIGQLHNEKIALEIEISKICAEIPSIKINENDQSVQHLAEIQRQLRAYEDLLHENKSQHELEKKLENEKREVLQLRKFNKELESQFNSQMDIIVELKKRYLDLNAKKNENSKSHESISWTSSGSSDEQYHTEETHSEEGYDGVFPKKVIA